MRDLEALPLIAPVADKIDLTERIMTLDGLIMVNRHGFRHLDAVLGDPRVKIPDAFAQRILETVDWDATLRTTNRWYDRLAEGMRIKNRAAREKQLDGIDQELSTLKAKLENPAALARLFLDAKATAADRGKLVGDGLVTLLIPAVREGQRASDRSEQTQRNLHVAFALVAYQRAHGSYPKQLDALAPKYLKQVPLDLFSGKALIYRPAAKGFLLYSVGPNGQDDGGRSYDDDPAGDDLRVRLPLR